MKNGDSRNIGRSSQEGRNGGCKTFVDYFSNSFTLTRTGDKEV